MSIQNFFKVLTFINYFKVCHIFLEISSFSSYYHTIKRKRSISHEILPGKDKV